MTEQRKIVRYFDIIAVSLAICAVLALVPLILSPVSGTIPRAFIRYGIYILIAAIPVAASVLGRRPVFQTLGFKKENIGKQLLPALPVFAITACIFVIFPILFGVPKTVLLDKKPADTAALVLQVVHLMVFVSFGEELVFRGYLFERLKNETNSGVWTVVLTSVGFGLWHFPVNQDYLQILLTSAIGFVYGLARLRLKNCSTLTVAVAHGLHDTFILVLGCVLL